MNIMDVTDQPGNPREVRLCQQNLGRLECPEFREHQDDLVTPVTLATKGREEHLGNRDQLD